MALFTLKRWTLSRGLPRYLVYTVASQRWGLKNPTAQDRSREYPPKTDRPVAAICSDGA